MSEPDGPHTWPWRIPGGEADRVPGVATACAAGASERDSRDPEVVELALLLPAGDVDALEKAAWQRGLTLGQVVRQLITGFLRHARQRQAGRW